METKLYQYETAFELSTKRIEEERLGETLAVQRPAHVRANGKRFYIESYGCQMNFADSEVVASILANAGYDSTTDYLQADVILINTCAIREHAEQRVRNRLQTFNAVKKRNKGALVGVLGCMAERLKEKFLEEEKIVDIVAGPDAYRSLPALIEEAETGQKAVNVLLSREETYAEINPVRLNSNGVTAFISIMRGCDNMCSFCVVPLTRGRERSRDYRTIVAEARDLYAQGYREVTLLGQNVDSYRYSDDKTLVGKKLVDAKYSDGVVNFARLLEMVANIAPDLRVRFSTSHPKDMTDDVLHVMAQYDNICKYIHLPVQSGNSRILGLMNRTYDREWYLERIRAIRRIVPEAAISTDIIAGFCTETEEEHRDTLRLMEEVRYSMAYMFIYSERPGTPAAKRYRDDVPEEVKKRRLHEIIELQLKHSLESNRADVGKTFEVLIEGTSARSAHHWYGRNSQNKVVVFPKGDYCPGQYANVKITDCTSATLLGEVV
ncbi:MAG: tRNA (N6-isopentenyl adenosine(37)-C2)-methylthiotransferase MiaB [Chitinophagales bacterium]|nr:tRNA (N6-isopentenyl adenosine(37)-C2)-methylthiotransferase MiaB [Chitinophagales bacterium]MDW8419323.1 tRNA (N6-isopentenyl adenosine(37)-C2)-methylthiotransferase MiaB [Chitinophagales bacterium]